MEPLPPGVPSRKQSLLPQRSLGKVSPLDNGSGSGKRYLAQHLSRKSDQGFYGIIATMDVYGFNLTAEQFTEGSVLLHDEDGSNIIQIGWEDGIMGDWLVYYGFNGDDPALIGRFPKSLSTGGLANRAAGIQFGGYVWTNTITLTPMGSGYLPKAKKIK
ncbi:hypothetical protein ACQ4PT_053583 [Festuca glaucescens]